MMMGMELNHSSTSIFSSGDDAMYEMGLFYTIKISLFSPRCRLCSELYESF